MKDITIEEAVEILNTFKLRQRTKNYNKLSLEDVKAIEKVLNELEKKDRIIDAMTKEWFELDSLFMIRGKNIHSEEELKQYFEKEVKENVN